MGQANFAFLRKVCASFNILEFFVSTGMSNGGLTAVEGLERASRISLYAQEGYALPALQGRVLDLLTLTHNPIHTFFWRLDYDEESLKLVLAEGMQGTALCLHTTEEFLYVLCEEGHFYRIPRSGDFVPHLSEEYRFSLRPWGDDDRRRDAISFATSCDNTFIYAATTDLDRGRSAILVEIDVKHDIGRYRTIYSGEVHPPSATILNGKATLFWLDGWHPRNAYKWTRGGGGPGSKDTFALFLQHHAVEFTSLTLSNQVGWLGVGSLLQERVWQVDLATEAILAVFQSASEPYGIRARPDGGLLADLLKDSKEVLVEVWKPVLEPRPHKPIMMRRIVPTTT
ncbi:hypothetical protein FOZ63_029201 [Perkinsus olseni]|uniref:Uncharacterized protein n=1 Tax=Perkinsus olseni TaxID=32597 RepID=A0A7J6RA93_PEROL|nr:hypothetical protein FOZ60_012778 [Perkinsus olseni]KAF4716610.1 hypothetical protein FOZ63_029201 [Perkinsus olseni]KAF4736672.1 hypothetical protein FOZ62_019631 [Perkinsus olseni]